MVKEDVLLTIESGGIPSMQYKASRIESYMSNHPEAKTGLQKKSL